MNNDLIKRSDAISAIRNAYHHEYDGYGHQLKANITALEEIPAVEAICTVCGAKMGKKVDSNVEG